MAKRKIINIDEDRCNGCGLCIPNCPEGALQLIDGKVRLISDLFCDGLGACIGHCPENAITIEERDAGPYNEGKVMENIVRQGKNVIKAHLDHLKEHGEKKCLKEAVDFLKKKGIEIPVMEKAAPHHHEPLASLGFMAGHPHGSFECPGSKVIEFGPKTPVAEDEKSSAKNQSQLRQWPIQIMLVPPFAPYLKEAELLIAADCVPFAYADFHKEMLKGKTLLIGCPKLDDVGFYKEKLTEIFKNNNIKSVTYAHMEVPCCFGLVDAIQSAISGAGKKIPFKETIISIKGERIK